MGSISAARELRPLNVSDSPTRLAKVISFRARKPEPEMPRAMRSAFPQCDSAVVLQFNKLLEAKYQQKEKGAIRRAAEPPSDHYLMAWVVWVYYLVAHTKAGFKASEESRRLEIHQKSVSGLGK